MWIALSVGASSPPGACAVPLACVAWLPSGLPAASASARLPSSPAGPAAPGSSFARCWSRSPVAAPSCSWSARRSLSARCVVSSRPGSGFAARGSPGAPALSPAPGPRAGRCAVSFRRPVPPSAPPSSVPLARVAWSAFRAGSLRAVCVRPGRSGAVVVASCLFASSAPACAFARRWASRLGRSVVVRPRGLLGWAVSVPVVRSSSRPPACFGRQLFWSGGLRGFAAALRRSGLVWGV